MARPWIVTETHSVQAESPEQALARVHEGQATFVEASITLDDGDRRG